MNRLQQWQAFSQHMERYIASKTEKKYNTGSIDLISMCMERPEGRTICLFNCIKYAVRLFNGCGKQHDLEKIVHYASILWREERKKPQPDPVGQGLPNHF